MRNSKLTMPSSLQVRSFVRFGVPPSSGMSLEFRVYAARYQEFPGRLKAGLQTRFPLAKRPRLFHRLAMQSYELLREVFEKKTPKQVAADLGLSLSMVYKWAEPPNHASGSGTGNPLDRIEALLASTGDHRLVQWICQRAGGFFIHQPEERAASALPDSRHQPDCPGIRRPAACHRHRHRR